MNQFLSKFIKGITNTLRCFCCDLNLSETASPDRPTGRYYCTTCFESTLEVQLAAASREIEWSQIDSNKDTFNNISEILEEEGWSDITEQIEDIEEEYNE